MLRAIGGTSVVAGLWAAGFYLRGGPGQPSPQSAASTSSLPTPGRSTIHDHAVTGGTSSTSELADFEDRLELVGQVGPFTVPSGTLATISGDVELTGDLTVEGVLDGVASFTLEGNGYAILAQRGGRIRLVGTPKTAWARVGSDVLGWDSGDRLAVAPTAVGVYNPAEDVWDGAWESLDAPPAVTLLDGRIVQAEVANLTRSVSLKNLGRLMLHSGAGPSEFRHIAFVDCGTPEKGFYPLHFHMNGSSVSGSIVEGVVVEGGRNRAFVPHGSHGIQFTDCVAYNTTKRPYWWDEGEENESQDISYEHCLAMLVSAGPDGEEAKRLAGFQLGLARRSKVVGCAVVGVQGSDDSGGFWWPAGQSLKPWDFRDNVSHNNVGHGFIVWQNGDEPHFLADSVAYRNSRSGVDHGAYRNAYAYRNMILQENATGVGVTLHANARDRGQTFENIRTDGLLYVENHNQPPSAVNSHTNATYSGVVYDELGKHPSSQEFFDCGLRPEDFDLSGIHPDSKISIHEGSEVLARWEGGAWN
jgi:hypothetical protein